MDGVMLSFRVWADGTVQAVEDGSAHSHMSDDFMVVLAPDEEQAAAIAESKPEKQIDFQQIIFALQRAEQRLQAEADALSAKLDYAAEFFSEDAERMREAQAILNNLIVQRVFRAPLPPEPPVKGGA